MRDFSGEIFFKTARSGGKGGQNVNKVETMAEAWWHIAASQAFTPEEKALIQNKLQNRINKDGYLIVKASETRSQLENKLLAKEKMTALVEKAVFIPKQRKPTKVSRAVKERRLDSKKKSRLKSNSVVKKIIKSEGKSRYASAHQSLPLLFQFWDVPGR